nr:MAG TPA: transposase [Caudoviricetes sp.]
MVEYYEGRLCIPAKELVERGLVSEANYKKMAIRKKLDVARTARGLGNYALVAVDTLPAAMKEAVKRAYPNLRIVRLVNWVRENYDYDQRAYAFFSDPEQCGVELPRRHVREYTVNAGVISAAVALYNSAKAQHTVMGEAYDWDMMAEAIDVLKQEYGHTLPTSTLRFRKKVAEFKKKGYACLISGKFGNQSARKVDHKTERLILGLAVLPNKPFNSNVHDMYLSFVCGELEVYDPETGELFCPDDFTLKNGEPKTLSEGTINNVLNAPKNKLMVEHALSTYTTFMHEQMPHMHRHSGRFSLSQITMDDVDLTRKLKDTKQRVHAYYAYDVVSQCVIGASYGRKKDESLVVACFRDMFRTIARHGWGIPAGIEVENHLMSQYRDGFLRAGEVFPFVHFCAPQNSQEKYAEPLNGAKKRSIIHKNHTGIGRFYGKGKWRQEYKKVSDEWNDTYEDREYFTWEELVADDRADSAEWNNTLHPDQKRYPGMTRWQVLVANVNPTLLPYDARTLARHIGEAVETSVRRNSTVRVAHEDWWLSSTATLERLAPNNYKVTAYYLPDEEGGPTEVYLYQGDRYIDKVERVDTYNRVMAEQTDEDVVKFIEQQKKVAGFRKYVTDNAIHRVGVMKTKVELTVEGEEDLEVATPQAEEEVPLPPIMATDWSRVGVDAT